MPSVIAPVAALLLSVAFLLMGNGLQGTLLPVRANIETFATTQIGLIGTAYYIGFAAGCVFGPRLVQRAGHIRTFAAMASIASAVALAHALIVTPLAWWLLRAMAGFCFATLYVVIESWLNERSTNETRGKVLAVYNMINLTVITIGQMMLTLYDPASFALFCLASILVSIAAVPVAMTAAPAPAPVGIVRLRLKRLYRTSPVGSMGALAVGLANGAFWALGPVFAQNSGLDVTGIALFMSVTVIAGAVGQWPLGRLSDRMDRRRVILAVCILASLAGIGMVVFNDAWTYGILIFCFLFGLVAFPLYAVCAAHANDLAAREDFVETSSGMLLLFAGGAAAGAELASIAMATIGTDGLFAYTATVHAAMAVFTVIRMRRRDAPPPDAKDKFVGLPRTAPTVFELDPRSQPPAGDTGDAAEVSDSDTAADAGDSSGTDTPDADSNMR